MRSLGESNYAAPSDSFGGAGLCKLARPQMLFGGGPVACQFKALLPEPPDPETLVLLSLSG